MYKPRPVAITLSLFVLFLFLRFGNGYFLAGDSTGYYAYLPAITFEKSLNFSAFTQAGVPSQPVYTETGLGSNLYSCGVAYFWFPFFLFGELMLRVFKLNFLPPCAYQRFYFTNAGTFVYGIITLFITWEILKKLNFTKALPLLMASAIFGSSFFFYATFGAAMSHVVSAFSLALFFWLCLGDRPMTTPLKIFALGMVSGLIIMVRSDNAVYLPLLLVPAWPYIFIRVRTFTIRKSIYLVLFSLVFFLALAPQFMVRQKLFGNPFIDPKISVMSSRFVLGEVLFSPFHGVLFWNPIIIFSVIGYIMAKWSKYPKSILFIGCCFLAQILLHSFIEAWWGGYSFGQRYLADAIVPIVIGLCLLYERSPKKIRPILGTVFALCALWTMGLFSSYDLGIIKLDDPITGNHLLYSQAGVFLSPLTWAGSLFKFEKVFWMGFLSVTVLATVCLIIMHWLIPHNFLQRWGLIGFLILNSTFFTAFIARSYFRTPTTALTREQKDQITLTRDALLQANLLYRFTETEYLIKTGRMEKAKQLYDQTISQFYGTKSWKVWEMQNRRTIDPKEVFPVIYKKAFQSD